ncbi:MAG: hypothetical protein WAT20_02825, partial [Ferruginibacter sp.]
RYLMPIVSISMGYTHRLFRWATPIVCFDGLHPSFVSMGYTHRLFRWATPIVCIYCPFRAVFVISRRIIFTALKGRDMLTSRAAGRY